MSLTPWRVEGVRTIRLPLPGRPYAAVAKLAQALLSIAGEEQPPRRFIAGADAIGLAEQKVADLEQQIEAYRELSTSLALDELELTGKAR